jgi:hypothetical protein
MKKAFFVIVLLYASQWLQAQETVESIRKQATAAHSSRILPALFKRWSKACSNILITLSF